MQGGGGDKRGNLGEVGGFEDAKIAVLDTYALPDVNNLLFSWSEMTNSYLFVFTE